MRNRVDPRSDPIRRLTGVNVFDFIRPLASPTLYSWSCHWQGRHRVLWRRRLGLLRPTPALGAVRLIHGVSLVTPRSRLLEVALTAVDLVLF